MSLLDAAFDRTTTQASDGARVEIPRHTEVFYVPAGTAAPGVFLGPGGEEVGFWLTLRSLTMGQEMAIINRSMPSGRQKKLRADSSTELIRETLYLFHEAKPVALGGDDAGVELTRAKREWIWQVMDQRGRNLVAAAYDRLVEPAAVDAEGNE